MLFDAILIQTVLALSVLALPSPRERLDRRLARRTESKSPIVHRQIDDATRKRRTRPLQKVTNATRPVAACADRCDDKNTVGYSSNWAGAILNAPAVSILFLLLRNM